MSKETPSSRWKQKGEPDPHSTRYDCERAMLCKGELTDDDLANALYLCDHKTSFESVGLITAAKDRIRWLSRKLEEAFIPELTIYQQGVEDGKWESKDLIEQLQAERDELKEKLRLQSISVEATVSDLKGRLIMVEMTNRLLQEKIDSGIRVDAWKNQFDHTLANEPGFGEGNEGCNATLIIDDGEQP